MVGTKKENDSKATATRERHSIYDGRQFHVAAGAVAGVAAAVVAAVERSQTHGGAARQRKMQDATSARRRCAVGEDSLV